MCVCIHFSLISLALANAVHPYVCIYYLYSMQEQTTPKKKRSEQYKKAEEKALNGSRSDATGL